MNNVDYWYKWTVGSRTASQIILIGIKANLVGGWAKSWGLNNPNPVDSLNTEITPKTQSQARAGADSCL